MHVGVVAVQGDFPQHVEAIQRAAAAAGMAARVDRLRSPTPGLDLIVLPGGESTTIGAFLARTGLDRQLADHISAGRAVLGTCAGAILLSTHGDDQVARTHTPLLGVLDAAIDRNAYGPQRDSFEAPIRLAFDEKPFQGVFIRAPRFRSHGAKAEPVAWLQDEIVGLRQGPIWALTFHPELTPDPRLHRRVLEAALG